MFTSAGHELGLAARARGVAAPEPAQVRLVVLKGLIDSGYIAGDRQRQLAGIALVLARTPNLRYQLLKPAKPRFVLDNPDLPLFYRFTASDVPDELRHLLPFVVAEADVPSFEKILEGRLEFAK